MKIAFIRGFIVSLIFLTIPIVSAVANSQPKTSTAVNQNELKVTVPFFLIRHGQTDYNAKNISQGTLDIPINDVGRAESLKAAKELQGKGIKKIYSSNLSRAKETAEIIRKELGIKEPVIIDPDLRERSWGAFEGKPIEGKNKVTDFNITPPGGEAANIYNNRVINAFLRILNKNEEGVLIVSHGGSMRMFFEYIHYQSGDIKNAIPVKLTPPSKDWKIERIVE